MSVGRGGDGMRLLRGQSVGRSMEDAHICSQRLESLIASVIGEVVLGRPVSSRAFQYG